jgi:hypothetical protein
MTNLTAKIQGSAQNSDAKQLIEGCLLCVDQCDQLLQLISRREYVATAQGASSVGAHIRHILDRFHCVFAGLNDGFIDYDARKREQAIENSPDAASFALASVARRIQDLDLAHRLSNTITVRESVHSEGPVVAIPSSVGRELMGVVTHSIHHLAIIALSVKAFGYQLDDDLGKAPSTIMYERS